MGHGFSKGCHSRPKIPASQSSRLLQLPVDILHSISETQQAQDAMSLALTCKDLFELLFTRAQPRLESEPQALHAFLALLERDVSDRWYYCDWCKELHPFDSTSYGRWSGYIDNSIGPRRPHICRGKPGMQFYLNRSGLDFEFHHARLVMNRYIYGPDKGLPITIFDTQRRSSPFIRPGELRWTQNWCAKIIDGKLYLSATHVLSEPKGNTRRFRRAIDETRYYICKHTHTHTRPSSTRWVQDRRVPGLETPTYVPSAIGLFKPQSLLSGCHLCLTDYSVTTEWREGQDGGLPDGWYLTIKTYHRLGSCRSSKDWEWLRFVGQDSPYGEPQIPLRNSLVYPPGIFREAWKAACQAG